VRSWTLKASMRMLTRTTPKARVGGWTRKTGVRADNAWVGLGRRKRLGWRTWGSTPPGCKPQPRQWRWGNTPLDCKAHRRQQSQPWMV